MKVTEFSLDSDADDYIVSVTADKEDEKYRCLVEAIKGLQPAIVQVAPPVRTPRSRLCSNNSAGELQLMQSHVVAPCTKLTSECVSLMTQKETFFSACR